MKSGREKMPKPRREPRLQLNLPQLTRRETQPEYFIGPIALLLLVSSWFIAIWLITNFFLLEDSPLQEIATYAIVGFILSDAGLTIFVLMQRRIEAKNIQVRFKLTTKGLNKILLLWPMGAFVIVLINLFIFQFAGVFGTLDITQAEYFWFSIAMAIWEEIWFALVIQLLIELWTGNWVAGVIARAAAFTFYHFTAYGQEPLRLLAVFMAGIVLSLSFKFSKRLSVNMMIHITVNAVALFFAQGLTFTVS